MGEAVPSTKKSGTTILAESHGNDSGLQEVLNQAKEAPPHTPVLLEMKSVLNGTIQAFYDNKISKEELSTTLRGCLFYQFEKRANPMADMIAELKERGNPVIAIDGRTILDAQQLSVSPRPTTLEAYKMSKDKSLAEALVLIKEEGRESKTDVSKILAERTKVSNDAFNTVVKYFDYSPVNREMEKIARGLAKHNIYEPDLLTAEVISRYTGNGQSIVLVGEGHVSGGKAPADFNTDLQMHGIVGEALKAIGKETKIISVRDKLSGFIVPRESLDTGVAVKIDEYLIADPKTGKRGQSFSSLEELEKAVARDAKENGKPISDHDVISDEGIKGQPTPSQNPEYATLLANFKRSVPLELGGVEHQGITPATGPIQSRRSKSR